MHSKNSRTTQQLRKICPNKDAVRRQRLQAYGENSLRPFDEPLLVLEGKMARNSDGTEVAGRPLNNDESWPPVVSNLDSPVARPQPARPRHDHAVLTKVFQNYRRQDLPLHTYNPSRGRRS